MTNHETMKLVTERLCLRPLGLSHASALQGLIENFEVTKWLANVPHPYPEEGAEDFLKGQPTAWDEGSEYGVAITLVSTDEFMGVVTLKHPTPDEWEIGFWLGQPFWGAGYITEAVQAVIAWAFVTFGMANIRAHHIDGNKASARVLAKCGFRYTDERAIVFAKSLGREVTALWMELSRGELPA